jgi:hypothetical protein
MKYFFEIVAFLCGCAVMFIVCFGIRSCGHKLTTPVEITKTTAIRDTLKSAATKKEVAAVKSEVAREKIVVKWRDRWHTDTIELPCPEALKQAIAGCDSIIKVDSCLIAEKNAVIAAKNAVISQDSVVEGKYKESLSACRDSLRRAKRSRRFWFGAGFVVGAGLTALVK